MRWRRIRCWGHVQPGWLSLTWDLGEGVVLFGEGLCPLTTTRAFYFFVLPQVHGIRIGFKWHHSGNACDRDDAGPVPPAGGAECCAVSSRAAWTRQHRYPSVVKAALLGEAFSRLFCHLLYPAFTGYYVFFSFFSPTALSLCLFLTEKHC